MADTPTKDRKLGLPRTRVGGRFVTAYEPDMGLAICERIGEGETLKAICEDETMPARQTVHRWVAMYPEFARAYAAAREISAHALEEEALALGREILRDPGDSVKVRAYDVAMNQLRWSASRRNPRVYSERGAMVVTVPIQINTGLDLGEGSSKSRGDIPNIYTIEARVAQDVEPEPETYGERATEDAPPLRGQRLITKDEKRRRSMDEAKARGNG